MKKTEYSANSFRVLSDLESIRLNPGMYVGSTSNPTHLIEEILDNALDECLAGYANTITVDIDTKNNIFSISDDGRGIPVEKDIPVIISTVLHSGSKFKGSRDSYKICSGRHGIGLIAVNALSEYFQIETVRSKKHSTYVFENYNLIKKFSNKVNEKIFSTKISFKPDDKIFEILDPDINYIRQRLLISSVHLDNCIFVLIIDGKEEVIKLSLEDYFNNYCLYSNDEIFGIIQINVSDKRIIEGSDPIDEYLNIRLCYSLNGSVTPRIMSSVNLLPVDNGGTHVKLLYNILKDILSHYGKKDNKFIPQDTLCGLRVYIDMSLSEPEFGGQTKTQLINRVSYLDGLFNKFKKLLENYFSKNKDQLEIIIERFIDYRRKIESKNIKNKSYRRTSTKYTKLKDCKSKNGELFIVEGDSAAGSLIQSRNSEIHAIMPLKGKIPNVAIKKRGIIKNKEVQEIISAIGTGIEPEFDISKLRYDKIVIACDADPDGSHIVCLIIALFGYLTPEIIKQGKLFICKTPLFTISKEKIFKPIWTNDELENVRNSKYSDNIIRIKGLGELDSWQAKICIFDEDTRKLTPVSYSSDFNKIIKLLTDSDEKRKLLNGDY